MSRKNHRIDNTRNIVYAILNTLGNYSCTVITKEDNKRNEALRLLNKWNGINTNNIDSYLDEIVALHTVTNQISDNIEYVNNSKDIIPYIEGKYGKINDVIDCYNSFLDSNPLVRIKYSELPHVDLTGVMIV